MNRKLKVLGSAFATALALAAVMASSAMAFNGFTAERAPVNITGNQVGNHVFTAGAGIGSITCTTATFSGTGAKTVDTIQAVKPHYTNCKDSLGRTVDPLNNTLEYTFTVTSGTHEEKTEPPTFTPKGDIEVHGTITLTVTGSTHCTIVIHGPQKYVGAATYHNNHSTGVVTVTTNVKTVTATISGGFFACGTSATHSSTGTYVGTTEVKGSDAGGPIKLTVDHTP
jgi:hypothetical protein